MGSPGPMMVVGVLGQRGSRTKMAVMMAVNASRDIRPLPAFERALPNGLAVIVVPTGFPNLVSLQIPVQTGSRNEKDSADPVHKLLEVQRDHAYTTHTYKHTTMGFLRDIEDMPNQFAYSRLFFERWYRPDLTTLVVAGQVKPEEVMPLVERHWGAWKRGVFQAAIPAEPPPK